MEGYKKVFHVWFNRKGDWFPVGVGKNHPVDIKEADNAVEIAEEAFKRPGVDAVMVTQVETARYTNLEDGHEYSMTNYLLHTRLETVPGSFRLLNPC